MKFKLVIDNSAEEEVRATVQKESEFTDKLQNMVLQYNGCDRIAAYRDDEMKMLPFSDIECISVLCGKSYAVDISGNKYHLKYRLYELEKLLPENFIRINKSAIANKTQISHLSASFNGSVDAVFKSGYTDYVSRRCLAEIKRSLGLK